MSNLVREIEVLEKLKVVKFKVSFWNWTFAVSGIVLAFDICRQVYQWLRYGGAEDWHLSSIFAEPAVGWVGVQKAISFVWNLEIFWLALATVLLSSWISGVYDEEKSDLKSEADTLARESK